MFVRKKIIIPFLIMLFVTLAACGDNNENNENTENNLDHDLLELKVDFDPKEKIEAGETLELEAVVTFGDEKVKDADDVNFEYWEEGNKDDSEKIDATNNEDGTYTAEVTFDADAVIVMYAHTTARDLHTMPKRTVLVGDAVSEENDNAQEEHVEGFEMHFMEPDNVTVDEETELMVHLQMDEKPFEKADVRYEIWMNGSDNRDWVDADEPVAGEYVADYDFSDVGTYSIQVHVEDDDDLHEHETYEVEVNE